MEFLRNSRIALVTAGLVATATPAFAQSAPNSEQAASLELVKLSRALYERALETSDPVLMLSAARLRKDAGAKAGPVGTLTPDETATPEEDGPQVISWERWLDQAVRMAQGSTVIAGLAEDIRTSKAKGLQDGGIYTEASIAAFGKRRFTALNFIGGEFAEIHSEGLGTADIDMFVRDADGALVCSQTDPSNRNQCGWTPGATGPFDITLENKSDFADRFALMTN